MIIDDAPTHFTNNHAVSMTLRDYFAAKVMQASISKNGFYDDEQLFANWCYETADAMMKARTK